LLSLHFLGETLKQQFLNQNLKREVHLKLWRINPEERRKPLKLLKQRKRPLLLKMLLKGHSLRKKHSQRKTQQIINNKEERKTDKMKVVRMKIKMR
jgi:hypothetical protein